jgi:protein gp37
LEIQEQCQAAKVAFFFKQSGGKNKKKAGIELNMATYDEMPEKN